MENETKVWYEQCNHNLYGKCWDSTEKQQFLEAHTCSQLMLMMESRRFTRKLSTESKLIYAQQFGTKSNGIERKRIIYKIAISQTHAHANTHTKDITAIDVYRFGITHILFSEQSI